MKKFAALAAAIVATGPFAGPQPVQADIEVSLDELTRRWGSDLDEVTISSEALSPGLFVARGAGGAVIVSIGTDGVLLVDDQYAKTVGKIQSEINRLGGGDVDLVINTHGHFDHADGNPFLGQRGAKIIAHENARQQMMRSSRLDYGEVFYIQPPYPDEGLPVLTFNDAITLHYNDQAIEVRYFGPGHTAGDVVVHFKDADVLHVGDLYSGRYPYIDPGNGGSLSGLIAICQSILDIAGEETRIVSGHAPVATIGAMEDYLRMLETVYARLASMAKAGETIDAVLAAAPTEEFDALRGNPALFITLAYRSVEAEVENRP